MGKLRDFLSKSTEVPTGPESPSPPPPASKRHAVRSSISGSTKEHSAKLLTSLRKTRAARSAEAISSKEVYVDSTRARDPFILKCIQGDAAGLQEMLNSGLDLNESHVWGRTGLHWACLAGQEEVVNVLIRHGALLLQDEDGNTPLHFAARNGHLHLVKMRFGNRYRDLDSWRIGNDLQRVSDRINMNIKYFSTGHY